MNHTTPPDAPGADAVVSWFGYWPSFHDAEVLHVHLNRHGISRLSLHTWQMTNRTHEAEGKHDFVTEKHVVVTFELTAISDLELFDFSVQNVLAGLELVRNGDSFRLRLDPSYGIGGRIDAGQVTISITPGRPSGE